MNDQLLYLQTAEQTSKQVAKSYSTSFFRSISLLDKSIQQPILNIYGMVRVADEIVDTFQHNEALPHIFDEFEKEVGLAIERKYSTNLILHSFQHTYHQYALEREHVQAFLHSMRMDIGKQYFSETELKTYIYGSAEVVGLMCLKVFCHAHPHLYEEQKKYACFLGSFFQKINFLRDIASDYESRKRVYFSSIGIGELNEGKKQVLVREMTVEMQQAKVGIVQLPKNCRLGVYVAYAYYGALLHQISKATLTQLMRGRMRVSTSRKIYLLFLCKIKHIFGLL